MQAEDRPIHLATELIHAPRQHTRPALQKLYYKLSQTRAAYENTDFSRAPGPRFHSQRGKAQSLALFLPDRLMLIEEWTDLAVDGFLLKVAEVGLRVLTDLGAGQFLAQTVTMRTTFSLSHYDDAKAFMLDRVCGQEGHIDPHFRRPIATGGLRLVFPETSEHPYALQVLIESFRQSPREVYAEVKGLFNNAGIDIATLDNAAENVRRCRRVIEESVHPFLDQYDTPQQHPV
ncbi:MAG: hypothetical protein WD873_08195 [Candidatus Hydrogenedentales bacterium]